MEIPNEIKEMIGKPFLFSGTFLNAFDLAETELMVKDVKISDVKCISEGNKHPCVEFLVEIKGKNKWTKPFPIKTIFL